MIENIYIFYFIRQSGTIEMIQRKKADDISFEFSKRASSKIKQHTGRNELLLLARRYAQRKVSVSTGWFHTASSAQRRKEKKNKEQVLVFLFFFLF